MAVRLGINQLLILRAFQSLEAKHGSASKFTAGQLIDAIWFEVERLSRYQLTNRCEFDSRLTTKLREIRAAHGRVLAAKRLKRLTLRSHRTWSLAVETINPATALRRLIARGFVERTGRTVVLTETGRNVIESLPEPL